MANPLIKEIPSDEWTKIADNVNCGIVRTISTENGAIPCHTYRIHGGTGPVNGDNTKKIPLIQPVDVIGATGEIDVYVYSAGGVTILEVDV